MNNKTTIKIDLGEKQNQALTFAEEQPDLSLEQFVRAYPAKFLGDDFEKHKHTKVSELLFEPATIPDDNGKQPLKRRSKLSLAMDEVHNEEQRGEGQRASHEDVLEQYPEHIADRTAVLIAYHHELEALARFLQNDISVLVVCDKILTEFVYQHVCAQAGKEVVLDTETPTTAFAEALRGGKSEVQKDDLRTKINNLKPNEILVLRSLDLLDKPEMVDVIYHGTGKDKKPQLLAFLDPSLEVKKVVTDRFSIHISLMGLPRHVMPDGKRPKYTVIQLLTRQERERFNAFDPEGLYKNVSGLNAIQFRNAMRYVAAEKAEKSDPVEIYRIIRQFKRSTSDEIEIPDTEFDDIGGYEHVKQQLRRIIALIAGPIQGISEKQRGQLIPRGFVFHGPPGTGKTLFAKAIANELNATIQMISGPEIMDKYVGQSEDNLRRIFATARRNAPAVVFFDEFDSIASQRSTYSDGGARANNAVVAQLLTELDGFRQEQTVLVIGTTNRIDIIDEALMRPSRLRPIEIGLPDFAARQHVAAIHAKNFGVDALLGDLFLLANKHIGDWKPEKREIPPAFLDELFQQHLPYEKRHKMETKRADFLRELHEFLGFVQGLEKAERKGAHARSAAVARMEERLVKLGKKYGLDFSEGKLPELKSEEAETMLLPMQSDMRNLFTLLQEEKEKGNTRPQKAFFDAIMDLVAEYTENFNNDEIRAIFQEASLEHHMEGQLVTPRYLGQKIGVIRKRRDEREAVHLSTQRRNN